MRKCSFAKTRIVLLIFRDEKYTTVMWIGFTNSDTHSFIFFAR